MINKDYITSAERLSFVPHNEIQALFFLKQKKIQKAKKQIRLFFLVLAAVLVTVSIIKILA